MCRASLCHLNEMSELPAASNDPPQNDDRNEKNPTCAIYIEDQNPPPVDDIESQHPLDDFFPRTLWAYFKTLSVWRGLYSLEHVLVLSRNAEVAPIVELLF